MTHRHFCTLFDRNYLFKGIAMLESLARHCPDVRLFVLCMDDETRDILEELAYPHVVLIRLAELEGEDLLAVKPGRGVAEYCWTLTPCLPWHLFETRPEIRQLTYLDADLLFFSDVEPLFAEIGPASIAIIEHRFIPRLSEYEINGRFNVEWVTFRRDEQGMACLKRWREQCIEWCFNRLEEGRMGDQKYLDAWPDNYPSLCVLKHLGAGVAPWNYAQYDIVQEPGGAIRIDGTPLVFYHFHQLQMLHGGGFDYMRPLYTVEKPAPAVIYRVYEEALRRAMQKVRQYRTGYAFGIQPLLPVLARRLVQEFVPRSLKSLVKRWMPT